MLALSIVGSFICLLALAARASYKETWKPVLGLLLLKRPLFEGGLPKNHVVYKDFKNLDSLQSLKALDARFEAIHTYIKGKSFFVKYDTSLLITEYTQVAKLIASREAYLKALNKSIDRLTEALNRSRAYSTYQRTAPAGSWRAVMGLAENVREIDAIKKAYKRLAMKHHPDRGGRPAEMVRINQAYQSAQKELDFV